MDVDGKFLASVVDRYTVKPYEFWRSRIGGDPIHIPFPDDSNRTIEVSPIWDDQVDGTIRVVIAEISHSIFRWTDLDSIDFLVMPHDKDD